MAYSLLTGEKNSEKTELYFYPKKQILGRPPGHVEFCGDSCDKKKSFYEYYIVLNM